MVLKCFSWEGVEKHERAWRGEEYIKLILWEGVHKYDLPWQGEVFIKWVVKFMSPEVSL